jgi:hypothetical protein
VPDAELELVTYRRRAERVFGRFVPVAELGDALAVAKFHAKLALGNGSALDEGARLAASLLAARKGPRRVVLATDELVRPTLDRATALAALAALPADAVVHVIVPERDGDDRATLTRRDDAALAPLATRHHGIYVALGGLGSVPLKELAPTVLELVRPTRIEHVRVPGFTLESDVLAEGTGVRLMIDTPRAPDRVRLTGMIWSDPFARDVAVSRPFSVHTAAFVFGADEHQALSHDEQLTLAMLGRAVSPVTSYVAAEPGVRPSTIGFGEGWGTIGSGRYGTVGFGAGGGGAAEPPDLAALVDTAACVAQVRPAGPWREHVSVDTTVDEIVDVHGSTTPMGHCLIEAVWRVRLDHRFTSAHQTFAFDLSGS